MMEITNEEEMRAVNKIKASMDGCKSHLKALTEKLSTNPKVRHISIERELLKVRTAIEDLQETFHRRKQIGQEDSIYEGEKSSNYAKTSSKVHVSEEELANMINERKFKDISEMIKSSRADIKHVWAGYRKGSPELPILVVVLFNGGCKISREDLPKPFHTYECVFRHEHEVSDEACEINNDPMKMDIAEADRKKIMTTIHANIDELLQRHSNIEMVSISGVRSRNYGSSNPERVKEACIVIYVHVKGLIPIGEEEFQYRDLNFPIDVREGKFFFYDNFPRAKEYHRNLVMGCQIVGTNAGTLGGFLDLPPGGVACLTCAHLFLTEEEGRQFLNCPVLEQEKRRKIVPWQTIRVGQPDDMNKFGTVRSIILRPGSSTEVGIDAAIVTITDNNRLPTSGRFPKDNRTITGGGIVNEKGKRLLFDSARSTNLTWHKKASRTSGRDVFIQGYTPENPVQFCSGKCLEIGREHQGCEVLKFGASTDITRGLLSHEFILVGLSNIQGISYGYTLYNQMTVLPLKNFPGFAAPGDSGALVFMATNGNRHDLAAFGMVVGGNTAGATFVTPIIDVFKAFKLDKMINTVCFKSFDQYCSKQQIVTLEHLKQEQEQQREEIKKQNDKIDKGFKEIHEKLGNLPEIIAKILEGKKESKK